MCDNLNVFHVFFGGTAMRILVVSYILIFFCSVARAHVGESKVLPFNDSSHSAVTTRPYAPLHLSSDRFPLVVRFPETVKLGYAQKVLAHLEEAWLQEFNKMGFRTPLPDHGDGGDDRFDLYISTDLEPGIGGYTSFSGFEDETPVADAFGYVVIANEISDRFLRGVIAHEVFHASQMAYDWWEHLSFAEGTSVWIVKHVFPDEDIFWRYYRFFNAEPHRSLDFVSLKSPFQYGTGMFYQFLDERFGISQGQAPAAFIKKIWQDTGQEGYANQPNFLQTINHELGGSSHNFDALSSAWTEFGVWRLMVGALSDSRHFPGADKWEKTEPSFDTTIPATENHLSGVSFYANEPLSHSYILFERQDEGAKDYRLSTAGSPGFKYTWQVVAFDANGVQQSNVAESQGNDPISLEFTTFNASKIILVVSVLPGNDYNPE
jgi:hypothetical protein